MRQPLIPYNPVLKSRAKALRQNITLAEVLPWTKLKRKQMLGHDFDRQRPIDEYIVDLYCKALHLAIEVDGWSHALKGARDMTRQRRPESLGVHFLRFSEVEVVRDLQIVADTIETWIRREKEAKPTPNSSEGGERAATEGDR